MVTVAAAGARPSQLRLRLCLFAPLLLLLQPLSAGAWPSSLKPRVVSAACLGPGALRTAVCRLPGLLGPHSSCRRRAGARHFRSRFPQIAPRALSPASSLGLGEEELDVATETQFWTWAEDQGIRINDRIRLCKFDGVVGLRVAGRGETRSGSPGGGGLQPGDVVLEIPKSAFVSTEKFQETELGRRLGPEQIRLISSKVQIALVLLQASGGPGENVSEDMAATREVGADEGQATEGDSMDPWVNLVRQSEQPAPYSWTVQQIEKTQNPKLLALFGALKSLRRSQLDRVQPLVRGIGGLKISELAFDWAMTEVDRRSVLLPSETDNPGKRNSLSQTAPTSGHVVAPVLDFMLPDPLGPCTIESDPVTGNLKVIAQDHVSAGSRVRFRPPAPGIPNEVFLTSHGYIPEINTNDFIVLKGIVSESEWRDLLKKVDAGDQTAAQKFQLLKIFHDDNYSISAFNLPKRLLLALRILHLNPILPKQNVPFEELKQIIQQDGVKFFCVQNEVKVAQSLLNTAEAMLKRFPTTLEEDMRILKEGDLSADQRLAIEYRRSKKSLLHQLRLRMEDYLAQYGSRSGQRSANAQTASLEKFILQPVRIV